MYLNTYQAFLLKERNRVLSYTDEFELSFCLFL